MEYLETDQVRLTPDREQIDILDQTRLPGELVRHQIRDLSAMYDAIKTLKVRGAPCIGIFAGYAAAVRAARIKKDGVRSAETLLDRLGAEMEYLAESRPTAVNLKAAIDRVMDRARSAVEQPGMSITGLVEVIYDEAAAIHEEDIAMCRRISELGLSLLKEGDTVLTHCNAGPLATSRYGTALGPILLGHEKGMDIKVFADETRPLLQGARLTSWELARAGVDVTLICDNMASLVMKQGRINACMVGCDRVAANGDTANKIGTSGVAVLAAHYGIPFYVLGPVSSIDMSCATGDDIVIEYRDPEEIKKGYFSGPMAPEAVKCFNPAFDVTDASLITAIVTDRGIVRPPFTEGLEAIFSNKEGN